MKIETVDEQKFGEIVSLKTKIKNSYSLELADAIKNEEIKGLITTLGCGAGRSIDLSKLRYDRVIIATDADAK